MSTAPAAPALADLLAQSLHESLADRALGPMSLLNQIAMRYPARGHC